VPATVEPKQRATLSTRVPARVKRVRVRAGDRVQAGEVLASLADDDLRAQLAGAQVVLSRARLLEQRLRRLAAEGAATRTELDAAQANRAEAEAAISAASEALSYTELRSPFDALVQAKRVTAGDLVMPGEPLLELEGSGLELLASLSGDEVARVRAGGPQVPRYGLAQPLSTERLSLKWDGEWHVTLEVFRDLGLAFAAVLLLIFAMAVGWFGSFAVPWVILVPIPLSLIGIIPAHGLAGAFFTATSMIGFIAGAGIIVRNSIILVELFLCRALGVGPERARRLGRRRLRRRTQALCATEHAGTGFLAPPGAFPRCSGAGEAVRAVGRLREVSASVAGAPVARVVGRSGGHARPFSRTSVPLMPYRFGRSVAPRVASVLKVSRRALAPARPAKLLSGPGRRGRQRPRPVAEVRRVRELRG
jgi:biotin carboxyl carrier protein